MKNILDLKVYKIYNVVEEGFIATFDTLKELIAFLARHQDNSWWGKYVKGLEKERGYFNKYLDSVNMSFNDTVKVFTDNNVASYTLRTYVFLDPDNRIFDPRVYIDDIVRVSKIPPKKTRWFKFYSENEKDLPIFRQGAVPSTGKPSCHRGSYCRHPKTMNEKRKAADVEYLEYVKPKRKVNNLPSSWDEIYRHNDKSWKTQSKKRKQWER